MKLYPRRAGLATWLTRAPNHGATGTPFGTEPQRRRLPVYGGLWYHLVMTSKAKTVKQYLAELPADRREALQAVRAVILKNLPKGYAEGMQYGAIGYHVPHSIYPPGYHCDPNQPLPIAGLASQKNHMSISLMCVYADAEHEAWFREAWAKTGKKLDMGKSCVRFRRIDDVPLKVIGQAIKRVPVKKFIAYYESVIKPPGKRGGKAAAKPSRKKASKSVAKRTRGR